MGTKESAGIEQLRHDIRQAYVAVAFGRAITPADEESAEDFSDERALHATLYGRRWTEVPPSFVVSFAYALPLLTKDAFAAFLPAWLDNSLTNNEVREALVHTFAKEIEAETSLFMKERLSHLDAAQTQALRKVLAHALAMETGTSMAGEAQLALTFVKTLSQH